MVGAPFAAGAKHPFVGEHANANAVEHDNGSTVSMRLGAKPAPFNKHRGHMTKDGLFEPNLGFFGRVSESLFGTTETELDQKAKNFVNRRKNASAGSSKRLRQDSINGFPSILKNEDGFMWTGEIYMGKLTKMDVVYDTGSDWLVVEGSNCSNCEGNTYDIGPSIDTGEGVALTENASTREYGSASLTGREYTDTVCILFTACVENFEFFLIESQTGIAEPIDGILGMSRNKPFHIQPESGNTSGPLYVEHLFKAGVIGEDKFSFYFTEPGTLSWVDLGEPDFANIREDAFLEPIQMIEEDFFWGDYCQGVGIGNTNAANTYSWQPLSDYSTEVDQAFYSIVDTGSTAMMISALYYESLITKMMEQVPSVEWSFQDGLVFTPCDATYPNLYFMFNTKWLEVNPKDYLFPVTEDGTMCIFFIMPVNLPMNILGMPLYVDYYTIHDPVTGTIGWAPHTSSLKESVVSGTIPSKDQFLTVGEAATPQDGSSLLISWAVTALIVYLFLDWWGQFTRPQWEESLDGEQFIIMTVLFFAATFLAAIYLVQPLVYSFIHSQLSGTASASAMAAPRVAKNVLSLKTVDFIVYGLVLGLVSGLVLKKLLFRGVKPSKTTKKTASKANATATDISTLLAQVDTALEEQRGNQLE